MAKTDIDVKLAKAVIHKLGSFGTPPEFGVEHFTVGLEPYLEVIEKEYLEDILKLNLSSFKLITGNYGGGKTHFLYSIRDLAWRHNYVTSYVSLSPTECPFDRLELVYRKIAAELTPPLADGKDQTDVVSGIELFLRDYYRNTAAERDFIERIRNLESISFGNALKAALNSLVADDIDEFSGLIQWLKGEDTARELRLRHRISERIDRSTAFRMLRSLVQFINQIGYSGIVLLFDEAERGMSIASTHDKRRALDNLRQLIDECGNSRLPGAMFFYAVPDENLLLEGTGGVYEALKQRLRSSFTRINPMGVKINLENIGVNAGEFLKRLGERLAMIFEKAYETQFDDRSRQSTIGNMVDSAVDLQSLDVSYRRLFVIGIIEAFQIMRADQRVIERSDADSILRHAVKMLVEREQAAVESEEF